MILWDSKLKKKKGLLILWYVIMLNYQSQGEFFIHNGSPIILISIIKNYN